MQSEVTQWGSYPCQRLHFSFKHLQKPRIFVVFSEIFVYTRVSMWSVEGICTSVQLYPGCVILSSFCLPLPPSLSPPPPSLFSLSPLPSAPLDGVYIVGSLEEALNIRGFRYHPADIEATVVRCHKNIIGRCVFPGVSAVMNLAFVPVYACALRKSVINAEKTCGVYESIIHVPY